MRDWGREIHGALKDDPPPLSEREYDAWREGWTGMPLWRYEELMTLWDGEDDNG